MATDPPPPAVRDERRFRGRPGAKLLIAVMVALALNLFVLPRLFGGSSRHEMPYSAVRTEVDADNVKAITARGDAIVGTFRSPVEYPASSGTKVTEFSTQRPSFADDGLAETLMSHGVTLEAEAVSTGAGWLTALLINMAPVLLLIGGYVWMMRRASDGIGAMSGIGGIGRSTAVRSDELGHHTTFADVAGIDEAKDELVEIVDFLRSPERFRALGARAPRGVLLMGPPGTGKTLLARAVAGEANVPFFSMSASEFIEMIVGVGASRVRDLFERAKQVAPSIVFIDELDAIGRARGSVASFGGVDEREQTLNQILTEMDGFTGNEGVIVLAATNRPDVLDPALLRPGRFDRRVSLNPPDQAGRAAILAVHSRGVSLNPPDQIGRAHV